MMKYFLPFLTFLTLCGSIFAQTDTAKVPQPLYTDSSRLRISLVTCGPGDEAVWEVFGHTAIRVVDSSNHLDLVYNYGTFDYGPGFELQFMRGKLLYSLSVYDFSGFLPEYAIAKRSLEEQVLIMNGKQKREMYALLNKNAEPANKYYKYDFFFDNCATRIRDVFPRTFGDGFVYGLSIPVTSKETFRDVINRYFHKDHWTRLGVNILLGSKIDRVMTNSDIMFLPDYLRDGVAGATVGGQKIAMPAKVMLPSGQVTVEGMNQPLILTCLIALLTILGLTQKKFHRLGSVMTFLLLFVSGLLGCLILVMWLATDHQGCSNNYNLLWCLPLNIFIAFFNPKGKGRYALVAIVLMFVSLFLYITKVQGLTLPELSPLFVALLFVYGMIYKKSLIAKASAHAGN